MELHLFSEDHKVVDHLGEKMRSFLHVAFTDLQAPSGGSQIGKWRVRSGLI